MKIKCPICGEEGELIIEKIGYYKCYYVDHGDVRHEIKCIEETYE